MTTAALALAAACGTTEDVTLRLTDDVPDCTPDVLAMVKSLSVEAIATAGRCRLDQECPNYSHELRTLADVEAALRASRILLELPADETQLVVINGRPSEFCLPRMDGLSNPVMCAYGSLSQARDGTLTMELNADVMGMDTCPESIEQCP
jgi:hypothetical protein